MKYPALTINTTKLKRNLEIIRNVASEANINICAVTKCFCALPELTKLYVNAGFHDLGDSRLENLKKIPYPNIRKWLLRLPMISEAKDTVLFSDVSLNSEIETIQQLGAEAVKFNKKHDVILMVELGDLREGVPIQDAVILVGEILKVDGINLLGIGANFNCYGSIVATPKKLNELVQIAEEIEQAYGITMDVISGGNSGVTYLLENEKLPTRINNLRLGEVIFIGFETSFQRNLWELDTNIFTLCAEIIEIKEKPSMPYGKFGLDAFGEKQTYIDKGLMKRAIVACGRQDVSMDKIKPRDKLIEIIGQSSDHTILDITNADMDYHIGSVIKFDITYSSLLSLCTSEYIKKVLKDN